MMLLRSSSEFFEIAWKQPQKILSAGPRWSATPIATSTHLKGTHRKHTPLTSTSTACNCFTGCAGERGSHKASLFKLLQSLVAGYSGCISHPTSAVESQNSKFHSHEKPWWGKDGPNQPESMPCSVLSRNRTFPYLNQSLFHQIQKLVRSSFSNVKLMVEVSCSRFLSRLIPFITKRI